MNRPLDLQVMVRQSTLLEMDKAMRTMRDLVTALAQACWNPTTKCHCDFSEGAHSLACRRIDRFIENFHKQA